MSNVDLEKILARVRACISKAENLEMDAERPGVSDVDAASFRHEADAARTMADALMLQYAITEITEAPEPDRIKPIIRTIQVGPDSDISGYFGWLMDALAVHCRCKIRKWTSWTDGGWNAKVYGFESDVAYFDLMYTTIRLHMLGVLLPKINKGDSLEENAYRLHNAGYNWLQIAEMYGWRKYNRQFAGDYNGTIPPSDMKVPYWHKDEGWQPATQVGSRIKRAYHRAAKERGETVQKIAANGTNSYRKSAADGYVGMIQRRLWDMQSNRDAGSALILASRVDELDKLFREDNPDLFREVKEEPSNASGRKVRVKHKPLKVNLDAYQRGAAHARTADLNGNARAGSAERTALGG